MTEGAAQKFDTKQARIVVAETLRTANNMGKRLDAIKMRDACQRIEDLEKLVGLASAWLEERDRYVAADKPATPASVLIRFEQKTSEAREEFRRALEGSPE